MWQPSPFIPLPWEGRGKNKKEGLSPLFDTCLKDAARKAAKARWQKASISTTANPLFTNQP